MDIELKGRDIPRRVIVTFQILAMVQDADTKEILSPMSTLQGPKTATLCPGDTGKIDGSLRFDDANFVYCWRCRGNGCVTCYQRGLRLSSHPQFVPREHHP